MTHPVRSTFFALMGLFLAAASPLSAQARVGFVNIQQIMAQAPGLAEARATFEAEVQRVQPELQQTAQRREQELVAPIMQRVSGVIESVRVEGGYGLIFDTAAQGVIVAADPALDLTSVVLQKLGAPPAPAAN